MFLNIIFYKFYISTNFKLLKLLLQPILEVAYVLNQYKIDRKNHHEKDKNNKNKV